MLCVLVMETDTKTLETTAPTFQTAHSSTQTMTASEMTVTKTTITTGFQTITPSMASVPITADSFPTLTRKTQTVRTSYPLMANNLLLDKKNIDNERGKKLAHLGSKKYKILITDYHTGVKLSDNERACSKH